MVTETREQRPAGQDTRSTSARLGWGEKGPGWPGHPDHRGVTGDRDMHERQENKQVNDVSEQRPALLIRAQRALRTPLLSDFTPIWTFHHLHTENGSNQFMHTGRNKGNKRWLFRGQSPASVTHPGLHSNYKEGGLETSAREGGQTQDPMPAGLNMPVGEVLVARGSGCFLSSPLIPPSKIEVKQEGSEALLEAEKARPQM